MDEKSQLILQGECFVSGTVSPAAAHTGVRTCRGYTASEAEPASLRTPAIQTDLQFLS